MWSKFQSASAGVKNENKIMSLIKEKLFQNWFVIGIVIVIIIARINPTVGAKGG